MSIQSTHNFKTLSEFTIHVPKEVEVSDTIIEGDKTTTVKNKRVEPTPVTFCFKKPSRAEREEADLFRSAQWTYFLKKNVAPEAILLREYSNWGGILNEYDREKYATLRAGYVDANLEYERAVAAKDDAAAHTHLKAMFTMRDKIVQFEREQNGFFENSCESMARNRYTQYALLHFSYTRDSADKPWEPYFKGGTFDEKFDYLETLEDKSDVAYGKAVAKLLFVASLYTAANGGLTREDIDRIEKEQADAIAEDTTPPVPAQVTPPADVPPVETPAA